MISRPSVLTHRVYGVSFSVLNLLASSSETSALFFAVSAIRYSLYVLIQNRADCLQNPDSVSGRGAARSSAPRIRERLKHSICNDPGVCSAPLHCATCCAAPGIRLKGPLHGRGACEAAGRARANV